MTERSYEGHFRALLEGRSDFNEFAAATLPMWRRMAAQIHRRWRAPGWVTRDDTTHDLLLHAIQVIWDFDAARGSSVQRYTTWNAYDRTKKALHKARKAKRHRGADSAPSRTDRPLSSYGADGEDDAEHRGSVERLMVAAGAFTEPDQERALLEREANAVIAYADSFGEVHVLEALATAESIDDAARALWQDEGARAELRLGSEAQAQRVVRRTARAVAERMTA